MREIKEIVVHCADTKAGQDVGAKEIRTWHVEGEGWSDIGYHFVIRRNGAVEPGRPVEKVGAHVAGHNSFSIGLCLVGGKGEKGQPEANYTPEQYTALRAKIKELLGDFPRARVLGHRDFPGVKKACPCFDALAWWRGAGQ